MTNATLPCGRHLTRSSFSFYTIGSIFTMLIELQENLVFSKGVVQVIRSLLGERAGPARCERPRTRGVGGSSQVRTFAPHRPSRRQYLSPVEPKCCFKQLSVVPRVSITLVIHEVLPYNPYCGASTQQKLRITPHHTDRDHSSIANVRSDGWVRLRTQANAERGGWVKWPKSERIT